MLVTTLTKRMAEDLTGYLEEHGEGAYLHSDIDTVERKLSAICVWAGLMTCWQDQPAAKVGHAGSLAGGDSGCPDKEGFLRSERSLIQTIWPRRCKVNGKLILYGDKSPRRWRKRLAEQTERRRETAALAEEHGIARRAEQEGGWIFWRWVRTLPKQSERSRQGAFSGGRGYRRADAESAAAENPTSWRGR